MMELAQKIFQGIWVNYVIYTKIYIYIYTCLNELFQPSIHMAFVMSFPVDFREMFERPLPELEREWDYAHLRRRNPKILRKLRQEYDANE